MFPTRPFSPEPHFMSHFLTLVAYSVMGSITLAFAASPYDRTAGTEAPASPAIVLEGAYTAETLSVAQGGLKRGYTLRGLAEAAVQIDLNAEVGAPANTLFRVSGFPITSSWSKRLTRFPSTNAVASNPSCNGFGIPAAPAHSAMPSSSACAPASSFSPFECLPSHPPICASHDTLTHLRR